MKTEENKVKKKKKHLKWYIKLLIIILLIVLYAFFIGTKGIFIKEYKIETNKVEAGFHGFKIVQFSDLHYGSSVKEDMLKQVVNKINTTKPDVVIFTGDLINKNYKLDNNETESIINKLNKINAEIGKYYVAGEEDFDTATSILNLSGFINIDEQEQLVYDNTKNPIVLLGKENSKSYFEVNEENNMFKILTLHNPNDFNNLSEYKYDMVIAGHTHNGQINIPKIKDLFITGSYDKTYQKINGTKLFINSGIGNSKINARLFNHPIINLYRINKTSTK